MKGKGEGILAKYKVHTRRNEIPRGERRERINQLKDNGTNLL